MLKNVKNIEELKATAIKVRNKEKIIVFWPQFNKHQEQTYTLDDDCLVGERTYNTNRSVIAFYDESILYVIPYFCEAIDILEAEEFQRSDMFVPFSNREYPIEYKEQWEMMIREAKELLEETYRSECLGYAEAVGVKPIDQKLLDDKCILIPEEGILVNHPDRETVRKFPIIAGYCCDSYTMNYLGRYFVNVKNGIITFVNADGAQYITKSETVHRQLFDNGYRFAKFEEVFEDDEEPAEEEVLSYWNKLTIA